jgi:tRNA threonylcarbamoyladenosine biosynthesis protein TsaE
MELAENIESEKFPGMIICLDGELGSGKTIFVKGFAKSLGLEENITSPTFNIVKEYQTGELGSTTCPNIAISRYTTSTVYDIPGDYYLTPDSYGSGNDWHGPSITRVLPADENGDTGATDFTLSYAQKLCIGSGSSAANQKGQFQVMLTSGSGTSRRVIAGVNVFKGGKGKTATLRLYVNGEHYDQTIDLSYNNQYFKPENATTITKEGQKLTFNVCGIIKTYNNIELADVAVNEITLTCAKFGNDTALSYNGICWVKFVKNNCETWKDIPNKFSANDIVAADCKTGKILLNGVNTPALGVLGNDWEGFYLTPGLNQIGFAYSDWVTADYAPKIKVRYREVFL